MVGEEGMDVFLDFEAGGDGGGKVWGVGVEVLRWACGWLLG